jgi:hypothetical protein
MHVKFYLWLKVYLGVPDDLKCTPLDGKAVPALNEGGCFLRVGMPGDNSCFFHSINFVCENKTRMALAHDIVNRPTWYFLLIFHRTV